MNRPNSRISTDKNELDIDMIYNFLIHSYWGKGRSLEQIKKMIEHSMCFGIYDQNGQFGFARVVTDLSIFAYLADVFILESHRGQGYSKQLMQAILDHEVLKPVVNWYLVTKDAQGLYLKFGFKEFDYSESSVMKLKQ